MIMTKLADTHGDGHFLRHDSIVADHNLGMPGVKSSPIQTATIERNHMDIRATGFNPSYRRDVSAASAASSPTRAARQHRPDVQDIVDISASPAAARHAPETGASARGQRIARLRADVRAGVYDFNDAAKLGVVADRLVDSLA